MKICVNTDFVPLQLIIEQLGVFCSSVMLIFLFVLSLICLACDLAQYFLDVKTSDREVLVFAQYLFSFEKEAAMDKGGKGDSICSVFHN